MTTKLSFTRTLKNKGSSKNWKPGKKSSENLRKQARWTRFFQVSYISFLIFFRGSKILIVTHTIVHIQIVRSIKHLNVYFRSWKTTENLPRWKAGAKTDPFSSALSAARWARASTSATTWAVALSWLDFPFPIRNRQKSKNAWTIWTRLVHR